MGLRARSGVPQTRTLRQAALVGVPLDLTESFRAGTAAAPARIGEVWGNALEDYSPILDRDLESLQLERLGELSLGDLSLDQALEHIETVARPLFEKGFVLAFGGEHTASLALFRAARSVHRDALLMQLDAHLDLRSSYQGQDIGHATWLYWLGLEYGLESTVQLGVRSGTREEFARARECAWSSPRLEMPAALRGRIGQRPVYLTIDIDILDPSAAPGTGCPEPGGPGFTELEVFVHSLADLNVIGADVMEVLPACDAGDITSLAAAKLGRELLLMFVEGPA